MKWISSIVILACMCLCAGSVTLSTAQDTSTSPPILIGNWSGSAKGYTEGIGIHEIRSIQTMSVTEQKGRFFSGLLYEPFMNGTVRTERFAGIFSPDGQEFHIIHFDSHEHNDGWVISGTEIEMVFMYTEEPQSILLYRFRRLP